MYSSAIAPHVLFVLPYENNDDDCGSAAPLQDVAELTSAICRAFPIRTGTVNYHMGKAQKQK